MENCVAKVYIREHGENSHECQMLKEKFREDNHTSLNLIESTLNRRVGANVSLQWLVSMQMQGNENSNTEN